MKSLTIVLTAAVVLFIPTLFSGPVTAQSSGDRAKLIGTYELVVTETKDAGGKWTPTPNFNSNGYITYADTGHMGVHIMPKVRTRFKSNQPTPQEAQEALRGYTAYFGSFSVNEREPEKFLIHHRFGNINPGGAVDGKRNVRSMDRPAQARRVDHVQPEDTCLRTCCRSATTTTRIPRSELQNAAIRLPDAFSERPHARGRATQAPSPCKSLSAIYFRPGERKYRTR